MKLLENKTVLITGSNRGIGKAMVEKFASSGANLIAHCRKPNNEFENYIKEISKKYCVKIISMFFDVTNTEEMKNVMKNVLQNTDSIDILINNAGIAHGGFFQMTKIDTIRDVFNINLFSMMELTQIVLRKMIRQKSGHIINMSSIAGIKVRAGNSAYGVSKAAVKAWTETLAYELTDLGIKVNAIAPMLTDTNMAKMMDNKAAIEMISDSKDNKLLKPEYIADVALSLIINKDNYKNGETIIADGNNK